MKSWIVKNQKTTLSKFKIDNDSHWYWIPKAKLTEFNKDLEAITGYSYMEAVEEFDRFEDKYDHFRTGGSPDVCPYFFKQKE